MNKYQRIVPVVTALLVLVAWLFPPFGSESPFERVLIGHKFIGYEFSPPAVYDHINYSLLGFE